MTKVFPASPCPLLGITNETDGIARKQKREFSRIPFFLIRYKRNIRERKVTCSYGRARPSPPQVRAQSGCDEWVASGWECGVILSVPGLAYSDNRGAAIAAADPKRSSYNRRAQILFIEVSGYKTDPWIPNPFKTRQTNRMASWPIPRGWIRRCPSAGGPNRNQLAAAAYNFIIENRHWNAPMPVFISAESKQNRPGWEVSPT